MAHTTKRGARRMIERGLAVELPNGGLRMLEDDPRFECEGKGSAAAMPTLVIWARYLPVCNPQGFAHYPIPDLRSECFQGSGNLRVAA